MPKTPRADEAGGLDHALNRGNLRADNFRKDADLAAFERILLEGLQIHQVELYANWVERVNEPLSQQELDAVRLAAHRGRALGAEARVESIARRLNLESTMRPRGRPGVRFPDDESIKEA